VNILDIGFLFLVLLSYKDKYSDQMDIWDRFHQHFMHSFYAQKSPKRKGYDCIFCALGICKCKSCLLNVGDIDPLTS